MRRGLVTAAATVVLLAAGWAAAQDAADGETWIFGDEPAAARDPAESSGAASRGAAASDDGGGDAAGAAQPLPIGLALPPGATLADTLEELRRRCGPPTLAETLDAAVACAGLDPGAEDDLLVQARWAAALPRVRFFLRRDWQFDESLDLQPDPDNGKFGIDTGNDVQLDATVQWDLGALVSPPSATSVRRLALEAERARRALRTDVAKVYFERCLLRLQWDAVPAQDERRAGIAWAIAARDAQLDAWTGGFFRRAAQGEGTEGRDGSWSSAETGGTR